MKKGKAMSNSSKMDMSLGRLSYATSGNDGATSKKLSSFKIKDREQYQGFATNNNSYREESKLDVVSQTQKTSTTNFINPDNITFESIFHGG
jgi:hypothetical protein